MNYCVILGLCVVSFLNIRIYVQAKTMKLVSFFGMALFFFSLLIVKDFLDLCWIKTVVTEHVYNMDLKHYVFDQVKLKSIKKDIMEVRMVQLKHGVDVDITDPLVAVLFDERYSEERIGKKTRGKSWASTETRKLSLEMPRKAEEVCIR